MKNTLYFTLIFVAFGCSNSKMSSSNQLSVIDSNTTESITINDSIPTTEAGWKEKLTAQEYEVLRNKGTERAFSGEYNHNTDTGTYTCKGCGNPLFSSNTKFDSKTGWPSFYEGINDTNVKEIKDSSYGMIRTEVICSNCSGHLGHVFNDGPNPTGLRYCINSISLSFKKKE